MLVKDSWQYAVTSQATVPFTTDVIDMPQNSAVTAGQKILQARDLPPLSFTATRLLELSADPDVEVDDLAAVIEQDPALTARILGVANSAYFGQVNPVLSVETAIIRVLGFNMVKSLALSIAMAGIFDTSKCPSFDLETYWCEALGTAQLARALGSNLTEEERPNLDGVYLSGLLHTLGVLLLAHLYPQEYSRVLQQVQLGGLTNVLETERFEIGIDHVQAGRWLARRWHLPEVVSVVMGAVEEGGSGGEFEIDSRLVRAASHWMKAYLSDEQAPLLEQPLIHLPGLSEERTQGVERHFREQCDDLRVMAGMLS
jgi:HD-like signal output (HDOD) protein